MPCRRNARKKPLERRQNLVAVSREVDFRSYRRLPDWGRGSAGFFDSTSCRRVVDVPHLFDLGWDDD